MTTYSFLVPLLLGFALVWASAFTTAYSRRWGERGGQWTTAVLRTILGIPLWLLGFALAWLAPSPMLLSFDPASQILGWVLVGMGLIPVMWGHIALRWRTGMPSVRDTLVRSGLYARVRHPIYAGMILVFIGIALARSTSEVVLACALGIAALIAQARLEELDLVRRLPAYRDYMRQVPRFIPRLWVGRR